MRFIIDTNQASSFVRTTASHPRTIVIPPLVWAEILVPSSCCHQPRIEAIGEHDILFGMDYPTIYDHLCHMTEGEIREFDPVFPTGSPEHRASCSSFLSPSSKMLERAKQLKQASIQNAEILSKRLEQYAEERRASKSKGEKENLGRQFNGIDEADCYLISGENARVRTEFLKDVTDDGVRAIRASSHDSFYGAILENPALRRFLRLYVTFLLAYGDSWADGELNRIGPSPKRNDVPDMTLALYARDGDVILTSDGYLCKAFRFIDPGEKVRLATWEECV